MAESLQTPIQKDEVLLNDTTPTTAKSGFLSLALELRLQVYRYIIPKSVKLPPERIRRGIDHFWHRGNISILRVNKQIHDEVVQILYGGSTFEFQVKHGALNFRYHYLCPSSGKFIQESTAVAPKTLTYIPYIRNLRIELVPAHECYWEFRHSKFGLPKGYNYDWRTAIGQPRQRKMTSHDGTEKMVKIMDINMGVLLDNLTKALRIQNLHVDVSQEYLGGCHIEFDRYYLEPLLHLGNVSKLTFGGDVSGKFEDEASKLFEDRKTSSPKGSVDVKSQSNKVNTRKPDNTP